MFSIGKLTLWNPNISYASPSRSARGQPDAIACNSSDQICSLQVSISNRPNLRNIVVVKHVHSVWAVNIVSVGPVSHGFAELLSVEDVRGVRVHFHLPLRVALREGQPSAPNRCQYISYQIPFKKIHGGNIQTVRQLWFLHVPQAFGAPVANHIELAFQGDHAQVGHLEDAIHAAVLLLADLIHIRRINIGTTGWKGQEEIRRFTAFVSDSITSKQRIHCSRRPTSLTCERPRRGENPYEHLFACKTLRL